MSQENSGHVVQYGCQCDACQFVRRTLVVTLIRDGKLSDLCSPNDTLIHIGTYHLIQHETVDLLMIRTHIYKNEPEGARREVSVIIKLARIIHQGRPPIMNALKNEAKFYYMYDKLFDTIVPRVYFATDDWRNTSYPVIVLPDPVFNDFRSIQTKLNLRKIKCCISALAKFQSKAMKKMAVCSTCFSDVFYKYLRGPNHIVEQVNLHERARFFVQDMLQIPNLGCNLWLKWIQKLNTNNLNRFINYSVSTLVLNSFTTSNIYLRSESDSDDSVRMIDLRSMQIGPPVIDFASLLFTNITTANASPNSRLVDFCKDILDHYILNLDVDYNTNMSVRKHVIENLPFSYMILYKENAKHLIKDRLKLMYLFEDLGCFD